MGTFEDKKEEVSSYSDAIGKLFETSSTGVKNEGIRETRRKNRRVTECAGWRIVKCNNATGSGGLRVSPVGFDCYLAIYCPNHLCRLI